VDVGIPLLSEADKVRAFNRLIPEEYLDKQLAVRYWTVAGGMYSSLNAMQETIITGFLDFSGEQHIVIKYYRRNKATKRSRAYHQTIYKQDLIEWKAT
jgi:hypothetical protein